MNPSELIPTLKEPHRKAVAMMNSADSQVIEELKRAIIKHPVWPTDLLRQVVVVNEEMGEVMKAALSLVEAREKANGGDPEVGPLLRKQLEAEMVQVAAMAIRFLYHWKYPDKPAPAEGYDDMGKY